MKAILLKGPYHLEETDAIDPEADDQSVIVKVHAAGICGSDLHAYRGHHPRRIPPVILGHEFSGEIAATGVRVDHLAVGERVTVEPQLACNHCRECLRGLTNLCSNKRLLGTREWSGAFAEYVVAPQSLVHRLPRECSYDAGALIEPLAVAFRAVKRGNVKKGDRIAVLGAGNIGLLILQLAKYFGAQELVATDVIESNLETSLKMGATVAIHALKEDLLKRIEKLTLRQAFDAVFVAADPLGLVNEAIKIVKSQGTVVLIPLYPDSVPVDLQESRYREITILGATTYTSEDFGNAVSLIEKIPVDLVSLLVTHKLPLRETLKGFELMDQKPVPVRKVLIHPA